jgi:hypothetical protein
MPTAMDGKKLKKERDYLSDEALEKIRKENGVASQEGKIAIQILRERRRGLRLSARIIAWAAGCHCVGRMGIGIFSVRSDTRCPQ